ncbi:MAG: HD domain-containing protein [Planctomycetes bacterium]|nr:HD domain-containing protein [Planctomycetota bacterium]
MTAKAGGFRILVVDDETAQRKALTGFLSSRGYEVTGIGTVLEARERLETAPFELVIAAISLADGNGLDLLELARDRQRAPEVILLSGYLDLGLAIQGMRQGAYDFFHKPFNFDKIAYTVERLHEHLDVRVDSQRFLLERRERQLQRETALSLARAAEGRDRLNIGHGRRVGAYALRLGQALCFSEERLALLELASKLHDIGKIGIDDAILNKPGRLTDGEFEQMKRHSEIGEYIIKPVSFFREIVPAVRWHHERWDGTGYPDGLAGEEIPLDARIVGLCDFFDAITSKRPYREPASLEEALDMVLSERGRYFDPVLVDLFIALHQKQLESVA